MANHKHQIITDVKRFQTAIMDATTDLRIDLNELAVMAGVGKNSVRRLLYQVPEIEVTPETIDICEALGLDPRDFGSTYESDTWGHPTKMTCLQAMSPTLALKCLTKMMDSTKYIESIQRQVRKIDIVLHDCEGLLAEIYAINAGMTDVYLSPSESAKLGSIKKTLMDKCENATTRLTELVDGFVDREK